MPSVIGQMGQGGGPSLSGIFSGLAGLGADVMPQAAAAAANLPPSVPPSVPSPDAAMGAGDSSANMSYAGGPSSDLSAIMSGSGVSAPVPSAAPTDSSGGFMAAPAAPYTPGVDPGTSTPNMSPLNATAPAAPNTPEAAVGMNAGEASAAAAPIESQPWYKAFAATPIGKFLLGDVTGAKGALSSPITALGTAGGLMEAINRWQTQKTLQNPAALAGGAGNLARAMGKKAQAAILGPVRAEAQETGQINAPGLYAQSVAQALAPYQYQMEQNALRSYIEALQASEGAYPQGGLFGPGGGLVTPGTYGGQAAAA